MQLHALDRRHFSRRHREHGLRGSERTGGMHLDLGGTEVEFVVPLMVFGFMLCLLYVWTRSIVPCIVLHALNNSLALGVSQDWDAWTLFAMIASVIVVLAISLPLARRSQAVLA